MVGSTMCYNVTSSRATLAPADRANLVRTYGPTVVKRTLGALRRLRYDQDVKKKADTSIPIPGRSKHDKSGPEPYVQAAADPDADRAATATCGVLAP